MFFVIVKRDYHLNIIIDDQVVDYVNSNTLRGCLEYFLMYSAPRFLPLDVTSKITFELSRNIYGQNQKPMDLDLPTP